MAFTHILYIDEAGDEGVGKLRSSPGRTGQSQWLLVGSVIVRIDDDPSLPRWRDEILARFPNRKRKELHFRNFNHEQRVVICQEIAKRPIHTCVTFSNKATIPGSQWAGLFKRPGHLYNYLVRWLLERTTSYCLQDSTMRGNEITSVKVVFSRRQGTDYQAMREYMEMMRDGREKYNPVRSIVWSVFDPSNIAVENHSKRAGLQIADAVTSAYFRAVEPNYYGNYATEYADSLRPLAIAKQPSGNALDVGVTPVPSLGKCGANEHQTKFFRSFISMK